MVIYSDVLETIRMVEEKLDIRTITMGISLLDCFSDDYKVTGTKIYDKICRYAKNLVQTGEDIEKEYGIPIINKRVSVTPIALAAMKNRDEFIHLAHALDNAAKEIGVNFIGGYSALVQKGMNNSELEFIESVPQALCETEFMCSSINVGSTKAGINLDAVKMMGRIIKETAYLTRDNDSIGCAKFVVFANAVEDNPFMAGAFHGVGEGEAVINVGVSGPGAVSSAISLAFFVGSNPVILSSRSPICDNVDLNRLKSSS